MPRPKLTRHVYLEPGATYFKPAGVRMVDLEESILTVDEFEAIRLKDIVGLGETAAAKKMKVSQPTFNRMIKQARKKLADAIINGKAIKIEGGSFRFVGRRFRGGYEGD